MINLISLSPTNITKTSPFSGDRKGRKEKKKKKDLMFREKKRYVKKKKKQQVMRRDGIREKR